MDLGGHVAHAALHAHFHDEAAPFERVATCRSGFMTSALEGTSNEAAVTSPALSALSVRVTGSSSYIFTTRSLRLRMICMTSSLTPSMVENSCSTSSM